MNNFDDIYRGLSTMPATSAGEDHSFLRGYHSPHVASVAAWAFRQHDDAIWSHNHRRNHALYAMASSATPGLPFVQRVIVG